MSDTVSNSGFDSLLRIPAVLARLSISRATLYRGIQAGHYPAPVQIGRRAVGWRASQIAALIQTGITAA